MFDGRMHSGCPDCGVFERRGNSGQQSRTDWARTGAYRTAVGRRNSFNAGRDNFIGIHIGGPTGNAVICRESNADNRSAVYAKSDTKTDTNIDTKTDANIDAKINTKTGAETGTDANDRQSTGANYGSNTEYQTDIQTDIPTDRTDHGKADTAKLYDFNFL